MCIVQIFQFFLLTAEQIPICTVFLKNIEYLFSNAIFFINIIKQAMDIIYQTSYGQEHSRINKMKQNNTA